MSETDLAPLNAEDSRATEAARTIFVDVNPLAERHLTGIGRYTARLALALASAMGRPVRFFSQDREVIAPRGLDWSQDQDLACWGRAVWRGRRARLSREQIPADSLAIYGCLRPPWRLFPFELSLIHDFTTLVVPHTHSERTRRQFQQLFARDLLASDAAITHSHSSKADAGWLCDFDPEQIIVAPPGPSLCVERHLDTTPAARRPDVGLVVSTLEPRKNAYFLLDWFAETEVLPAGAELWWAGSLGWLTSRRRLSAYKKPLKNGRRIRFLGVVSDTALCRLYRSAGWSAYPSLYEGFGFPVLDALKHSTPVMAGYHSSLCELDHRGVFFFDPYDPATVDDAWRTLRANFAVAPAAALDALYDWARLARTILGLGYRAADVPAARAA
jgi:glycosyltransferase involved in cell wall biosynthesis